MSFCCFILAQSWFQMGGVTHSSHHRSLWRLYENQRSRQSSKVNPNQPKKPMNLSAIHLTETPDVNLNCPPARASYFEMEDVYLKKLAEHASKLADQARIVTTYDLPTNHTFTPVLVSSSGKFLAPWPLSSSNKLTQPATTTHSTTCNINNSTHLSLWLGQLSMRKIHSLPQDYKWG